MLARPLAAAGLLIAVAACTQTPQQRLATQKANAAAAMKLDQTLAGLTPDRPTTCMPRYPTAQVHAYGPTLVYTVSRNLKYRTDTAGGCERVGSNDILVTRSPQGQACQGDISTTVDQGSRMTSGSCAFGPFIRYSKTSDR